MWKLKKVIDNPSGLNSSSWGFVSSIYQNYLAVGAFDANSEENFRADVYERDLSGNWNHKSIEKPSRAIGKDFGRLIRIYKNYLLVGTNSVNSGEIYFYSKDTLGNWNFKSTIICPDLSATHFGNNFSLHQNSLSVLAIGKTFIFEKNLKEEWVLTKTIDNNISVDPGSTYIFNGVSVYKSNMVSLFSYSGSGVQGSQIRAYKKDTNGWLNSFQTIEEPSNSSGGWGAEIQLNENYLLVGSSGGSPIDIHTFAVYNQNLSGDWVIQKVFSKISGIFELGVSLSLNDNYIFAGATDRNADGQNMIVVYEKNNSGEWFENSRIINNPNGDYHFGAAVFSNSSYLTVSYNYGNGVSFVNQLYIYERGN